MTHQQTGRRKLTEERGDILLNAIIEDVDRRINPNGEECSFCGGEGYTHDCIDGCCEDAESGCDDCTRRCVECALFDGRRAKEIREEVIKSGDIKLARAWLKSVGRLSDEVTDDQIRAELQKATATITEAGRTALAGVK